MNFKKLTLALVVMSSLTACDNKDVVTPTEPVVEMEYTTINKEVKYAAPAVLVDLNKDNINDITFGVQLVGDPISQSDKRQFFATSGFETFVVVNPNNETPPYSKNEEITVQHPTTGIWYNASAVKFIERVEHISGTITWNGNWLAVTTKYLAVQVWKDGKPYNGWIELSIDIPNQRILVHRSAISKQPEKIVKAGV